MERLRASRSLPFVVVQKTFMTSIVHITHASHSRSQPVLFMAQPPRDSAGPSCQLAGGGGVTVTPLKVSYESSLHKPAL